jgi:undecaprenyl-diphosphatase
MTLLDLFHAAFLGVIEGLTEFIPVSSTGHLIVAEYFLQTGWPNSSVFIVFIQMGSILAVMFHYRRKVFNLALHFFDRKAERDMGFKILLAFLPAAVIGALFHDYIKAVLFSPTVVAVALIIGGVIMLWIERNAPKAVADRMEEISFKTAFKIGVCQLAALIPGVSRAGASIVGAQFLGVERKTATEFSFFLAMPTIIGASVYDLAKNWGAMTTADVPILATGFITAFIAALIIVRTVIGFVGHYGFAPFAYYRIIFGSLLLFGLSFDFIGLK